MKFFRTPFIIMTLSSCIAIYGNNNDIALADPGFEKGGSGWDLRPGAVIETGTGRSATHALKYEQTKPENYYVISSKVNLKPGAFYRFGAWIKTENVTISPQGGGATIALEFSKTTEDGKKAFLTGRYLKGLTGTNDWTFVSDTVRIPQNATGMTVSLYIWKGATGTAWFDDITVQEQGVNLWTVYTLNPYNTITDGKCTVAISHDGKSVSSKPLTVRMQIRKPALTLQTPVQNDRAEFNLDKLPAGEYDAEFTVLNEAERKTLFSTVIPLNINPAAKPVVTIDRFGRTLVNEQPFMPIGIFTAGLDAGIIDTLREAGLNCALPYGSMSLPLDALDLAAAKNFKVIFSCKDVGSSARYGLQEWRGAKGQDEIITKVTSLFKEHPALLAWYINDEQPSSQIKRLTNMRRLVNRLDPNHPTYGVLYQYEDLPMYGGCNDIIGIDPYPLNGDHLQQALYALKQARLSGLPLWVVPQLVNTEIYKSKDKVTAPNPSEEKMRSLVLLEAAYGAKGFIFYKFEDLKSWKLPKDNFAKEWPKVKNVVATLQLLEPYIMSEHSAELLSEGEVVAARLRNGDGKAAILICAIGPGPAKAELKLEGHYRSLYERTVQQDGVWKFSGEGISSDLLIEQ